MGEYDFFRQVSILKDLKTEHFEKLMPICRRVTFKAGEVILREGESGDTMYLFAEGEVEVTNTLTMKIGSHGFEETEKSIVKLRAGSVGFFGDMALFESAPRSATITASSECVLYEIRKEDFDRLCEENTEIGYRIINNIASVLCHRIRRGNQDILKLTTVLSIVLSKR